MTDRQPWERQVKEPPAAWKAFSIYRDMGLTRSLAKVGEELGITRSTLGGYSSRWTWVIRATAWDAEQDRLDQLWLQEERRKAATRHVRQAQVLQSKALQRLASLDPSILTPAEALRYAEIATKMERESLQLSTGTVEVNVTGTVAVDVAALSPEEVKHRLELLQAEVRTRLEDAERAEEDT